MAGVEIAGLTKTYGTFHAVSDMSLSVEEGEFLILLGPSGCGKTTTLRMVAGFIEPDAGTIRIGSNDVTSEPPHRRNIGLVFQNYALFPHLSLTDNVAFSLRVKGVATDTRRAEAKDMLDRVQLGHLADRLPSELSGGQQQRVALARALITNPKVLLLDEPLSALDEFLRLRMRVELKRLQNELGITFIHVTHTQPEAIALADQVVVMDHGLIEQAASPRVIYNQPYSPYVARFMGGQNVLSGKVASRDGDNVTVEGKDGHLYDLRPVKPVGDGEEIRFSIRRDRIRVATGPAPRNSLSGKVINIEYQGTFVKVALDTGLREEFIIYMDDDEYFARPIEVGEAVHAHWDAQLSHHLVGSNNSTGNPHED